MNNQAANLPELIIGDTKKTYVFIDSPEEKIEVRFTKWDGEKITEAEFKIINSRTNRDLVQTGICEESSVQGKTLALHSLLDQSNKPPQTTFLLNVENLLINKGSLLYLKYISYYEDEPVDRKWNCERYNNEKPDIVKGGVIKRP